MIQNINLSMLRPHPNNPRKEVGDISELSESIKKNGVFQNLTVVPNDDNTYTIIIGHRRFAAAKEAGLSELPCAVVEMTEKEQLSTMLLENMQREDLTVLEQAEGFQMMLDLGESIKTISEQTGFSRTTIHHRVELLKLDRDVLVAQSREIPLSAYIKLEKIKDIDRRNKVLQEIGTNNFDWALKRELANEKTAEGREYWKNRLSELNATDITDEVDYHLNYSFQFYVSFSEREDDMVNPLPLEPFFYRILEHSGGFYVYGKRKEDNEKSPEQLAREAVHEEVNRIASQLEELEELCCDNVLEFCHNFSCRNAGDAQKIFQLFIVLELKQRWRSKLDLGSIMSEKLDEDDEITLSDIPIVRDVPAALLSVIVDSFVEYGCFYHSYSDVGYRENPGLKATYECIEYLGYEASDEEHAYINGTHELYSKMEDVEE